MTTLFFFLLTMTLVHFVYDGIILPSLRLSLRYKLFALRDELRSLIGRDPSALDVFRVQQESINNSIRMLSRAGVALIVQFERRLETDPAMRNRIEERIRLVESYDNEEFGAIVRRTRQVFRNAVLLNGGASFLYIIPIGYVCMVFSKLKGLIKGALSVPEGELVKVIGVDGLAAVA